MNNVDPRHADRAAIVELSARFAWLIDHRQGHGVPELFCEDGRYGYEGFWCEGRQEIAAFYERRRQPGTRKSRHVFTNHLLEFHERHRASSQSILILFATDGDPAVSAAPISILDYQDTLVWNGDSGWRYLERRVTPAFGHMPRIMETKQRPMQ